MRERNYTVAPALPGHAHGAGIMRGNSAQCMPVVKQDVVKRWWRAVRQTGARSD